MLGGEARAAWQHSIDRHGDATQGLRYSVTFRTLRDERAFHRISTRRGIRDPDPTRPIGE